jgi:hypothetical protein
MLWFFAVGTAIGAALWVAVRIEPGREPVSADDSGPESAGNGARLPGPEADARRAVPGPAGWQAAARATRRQVRGRASQGGSLENHDHSRLPPHPESPPWKAAL